MSDEVKKILDRVAGNYNKMGAALTNAQGALIRLEMRTPEEDEHDAASAAIARSAIRLIDDCLNSLEAL